MKVLRASNSPAYGLKWLNNQAESHSKSIEAMATRMVLLEFISMEDIEEPK